MKMKRFMAALTIALTIPCMSISVFADGDMDYVTKTYEIDVKNGGSIEKKDVFEDIIKQGKKELELQNVTYEKLSEEPVFRDAKVSKSITKVTDLKDYKPDETITEDGITYTLKDKKLSKTSVKEAAKDQKVTDSTYYDVYTTKEDVPQKRTVKAVNEDTGESIDVECTLDSFEEIQGEIVEVPIIYTGYDGDYYLYSGNVVERSDAAPAMGNYEDQILEDAGLDPKNARITGISWSGDPYTDEDGELSRNALATVDVTHYRASYSGVISTPEKTEYTYLLTYEGDGKQEVSGIKHVTVKATASYKVIIKKDILPIVIVGIAVAILALLIILILFVLAKRRKDKEKQQTEILKK